MMATLTGPRALLLRRARTLEIFTIAWNSLEGVIAVGLGLLAGSIALVGFGIDSVIETSSGVILLWRLQEGRDVEQDRAAERRALRLVGASLIALGAYVAGDALRSLARHDAPEASVAGIVLAAISLIVMPLLARAKYRLADQLDSDALRADGTQTIICAYLSAVLLAGLALNAWLGWWWADPVAALAMVPIILREGLEAWRGEHD
jgi:divalent metal cation (Fe/Co/Zn/Cd) transporter